MATMMDGMKENIPKNIPKKTNLITIPHITNIPEKTNQETLPRLDIKPIKNWSLFKWSIVAVVSGIFGFRFYQQLFVMDPIAGIYSSLVAFLILTSLLFTLVRYKDPASLYSRNNGPIKNTHQKVSIIIPARNEPKIIRNTVRACLASATPILK
jgi:hypothetical protein